MASGNARGTNAVGGNSMCGNSPSAGDAAERNTAARNANESRGQAIGKSSPTLFGVRANLLADTGAIPHRPRLPEHVAKDCPAFHEHCIALHSLEHFLVDLRGLPIVSVT